MALPPCAHVGHATRLGIAQGILRGRWLCREYGSFLVIYRRDDLKALAGAAQACEQIGSAEKRDGMEQAQARLEEQIQAARASLRRESGPEERPSPLPNEQKIR